jgi:hypothetical protein
MITAMATQHTINTRNIGTDLRQYIFPTHGIIGDHKHFKEIG